MDNIQNNNQKQLSSFQKYLQFHLKTQQWVLVLVSIFMIVSGVFIWLNFNEFNYSTINNEKNFEFPLENDSSRKTEIIAVPLNLSYEELIDFASNTRHYCTLYKTSINDDDNIRQRFDQNQYSYCQAQAVFTCLDWQDLSVSGGYPKNTFSINYYPTDFSPSKCQSLEGAESYNNKEVLQIFDKFFGPNTMKIQFIKTKHFVFDAPAIEEQFYTGQLGRLRIRCDDLKCFENVFLDFSKNKAIPKNSFIPEDMIKDLGQIDYLIRETPSRFYKLYPVKINTWLGCRQEQEAKYNCLSQEECKTQLGESKCGSGRPFDGCTTIQTPKYFCSFIQQCDDQNKFCSQHFDEAVKNIFEYNQNHQDFTMIKNKSLDKKLHILFSFEPDIELRINDLKSLSSNFGFGKIKEK